MITIGLMYLTFLGRKIYSNEIEDNNVLPLCFVKNNNCVQKMMFSLLLRLQIVKIFVPGCTGRLRQMGLIVVTIKHWVIVLQQPILVGWD